MKKELRTKLRSVLAAIPADQLVQRSRKAAERLFNEPEYQKAEIMMVYLSHKHEADTTPIVLQAWRDHKRVLAPQIGWESRQMIPVEINNLDEDVAVNNPLGIREPVRGAVIPIELIDLVIVPGLGFDAHGNRLGRGRGFYDRFLGRPNFRGVRCGFGLQEQVIDAIPASPHDVMVHLLVTDEKILRFEAATR